MARSADALRVAKGMRKVAKAFLDAEGPAVASQVLRMKDHGVGVSTSLKDVSQGLLLPSTCISSVVAVVLAGSLSCLVVAACGDTDCPEMPQLSIAI